MSGVTLIELVVAMAIMGLVGAMATPMLMMAHKSFLVSTARAKVQGEVSNAIKDIVKQVERAELFTWVTGAELQVAVLERKTNGLPIPPADADYGDFDFNSSPQNYRIYRYWLDGTNIRRDWRWGNGGWQGENLVVARDITATTADAPIPAYPALSFTYDVTTQNRVTIVVSSQTTAGGQRVSVSNTTTARLRCRRAGI